MEFKENTIDVKRKHAAKDAACRAVATSKPNPQKQKIDKKSKRCSTTSCSH
jgi:hypothetical protein